jgi:ribosomal 30S subunit maturation factor RimM
MTVSDLVAIGRLGNKIDQHGYIQFNIFPDFKHLNLTDIFLFFTDNRVRYVTILDKDKHKFLLDDQDSVSDALLDGNVKIMLPSTEVSQHLLQSKHIGKKVIFEQKELGIVYNCFENGAQEVLEIRSSEGKEFMVPLVKVYFEKSDSDTIWLKNISELMEL